jgi:hypothetical protein
VFGQLLCLLQVARVLYDCKADEGKKLSSEAVLASGKERRTSILATERNGKTEEKEQKTGAKRVYQCAL